MAQVAIYVQPQPYVFVVISQSGVLLVSAFSSFGIQPGMSDHMVAFIKYGLMFDLCAF